jgi:hypothetical protein
MFFSPFREGEKKFEEIEVSFSHIEFDRSRRFRLFFPRKAIIIARRKSLEIDTLSRFPIVSANNPFLNMAFG